MSGEWVELEERLPEPGTKFIMIWARRSDMVPSPKEYSWWIMDWDHYLKSPEPKYSLTHISHWQPLPKPPTARIEQ